MPTYEVKSVRIIICLKRTLNPSDVDSAYKGPKPANACIANPNDRIALEKALELRGILKGSKVVALTVGPPQAREVLSFALARGCDSAVHLQDDCFRTAADYGIALALSKTIEWLGFSLIICGNESVVTNAGFIPTALAEMMNIPVVNDVIKIEDISTKSVRVWRRLDKGVRQVIDCTLPAVLSIDPLSGESPYVPLFALKQAAENDIRKLALADVGLLQSDIVRESSFVQILSLMPPKPRSKRVTDSDSDSSLLHRLSSLFSDKTTNIEKKELLQGKTDYLADCILKYLVENDLLPER
jgi:electron transfer flavoprotein alpha/beta subunit